MLKRVLVAAAMIVASPALVSAQSFFFSFSDTELTDASSLPAGTVAGEAFIFSDGMFGFNAADINLTTSDNTVLRITGGTANNPNISLTGQDLFNSSEITANPDGSGRLFSVSLNQAGINPGLNGFSPAFNANVGPNGGTLLGTVNFDVVGEGSASLGFAPGVQGILARNNEDLIDLSEEFASATGNAALEATPSTAVPEPSSLAFLVLGSVALVSRRKRS
jgi:hypothetical protein